MSCCYKHGNFNCRVCNTMKTAAIAPKIGLSQESLENLVIAALQAKSIANLHVALPLDLVFTPWILNQIPDRIKTFRMVAKVAVVDGDEVP